MYPEFYTILRYFDNEYRHGWFFHDHSFHVVPDSLLSRCEELNRFSLFPMYKVVKVTFTDL